MDDFLAAVQLVSTAAAVVVQLSVCDVTSGDVLWDLGSAPAERARQGDRPGPIVPKILPNIPFRIS